MMVKATCKVLNNTVSPMGKNAETLAYIAFTEFAKKLMKGLIA